MDKPCSGASIREVTWGLVICDSPSWRNSRHVIDPQKYSSRGVSSSRHVQISENCQCSVLSPSFWGPASPMHSLKRSTHKLLFLSVDSLDCAERKIESREKHCYSPFE